MRIIISKDNLMLAINATQRAINPKSIIPLYSCIHLETKDNHAFFTGAGLDITIECTVPAQIEQEGSAFIPARYFSDIVRRLPDVPIILEHDESMELSIRCENSFFSLRTISATDFPQIPDIQGDLSFTVNAETLAKLIRQSSFAASTDELKGVFTGILWEIEGSDLCLIGSDMHRLAWTKSTVSSDAALEKISFILPAKHVVELGRLIQSGDCQISGDNHSVSFRFDNICMNCHTLSGIFPDYRSVVPQQFMTTLQVESKMLRDAAERISLFSASNDTSNTIYFVIDDNHMEIHSQSEIGYGRESLPVAMEGESLDIAFNSRYLTDVFRVLDCDQVDVQLSGQLSAGIIKDRQDEDFFYLLLPVRY